MKIPHVVIIGGGFGGLAAAKKLARKKIKVTLVDKRNYHLFQPLLYQVATAGLSPAEMAYPFRALLSGYDNVDILMGEVRQIHKEEKWIETETNRISFDYLILACGSVCHYFNSPHWKEFAPGLKTISNATDIRKRIFEAFEKAERESDIKNQKKFLTFTIIGGGPTGVELAGSIGEITRYTMKKDFHHITPQHTRILLIEAGPRILPSMSEDLSIEATHELQQLGVEVWTNTPVSDVNERGVKIKEDFIECSTVLWAAGLGANPLNQTLNVGLDKQGRVIVDKNMAIPGHPSLFVIGDQAHYEWGENKSPLPGLAPVAMQQGRFIAKYIEHTIKKKPLPQFQYVDKGQMATIGRSRAVAMYRGHEFHGFIAWAAWLLVHIYYLIGFKNRLFVIFQWAWTYFTYRRGARLIIGRD